MGEQSDLALYKYFYYYYDLMDRLSVSLQRWLNKVNLHFVNTSVIIIM